MKPGESGGQCGYRDGSLPAPCAPLAFPYVPVQEPTPKMYGQGEGLSNGTLFPGLNLPFFKMVRPKGELANTAQNELMALGFAIGELGLYLDTHPDDRDALELYTYYANLNLEATARYAQQYGPVFQTQVTNETGFTWINSPWPWELGEKAEE